MNEVLDNSLVGLMLIVDSRRGLQAQDAAMLEWALVAARAATGGQDAARGGSESGGFWSSNFTKTVVGGLAGTLVTGISSVMATLPARTRLSPHAHRTHCATRR